jgi:hypothetical protein
MGEFEPGMLTKQFEERIGFHGQTSMHLAESTNSRFGQLLGNIFCIHYKIIKATNQRHSIALQADEA